MEQEKLTSTYVEITDDDDSLFKESLLRYPRQSPRRTRLRNVLKKTLPWALHFILLSTSGIMLLKWSLLTSSIPKKQLRERAEWC